MPIKSLETHQSKKEGNWVIVLKCKVKWKATPTVKRSSLSHQKTVGNRNYKRRKRSKIWNKFYGESHWRFAGWTLLSQIYQPTCHP